MRFRTCTLIRLQIILYITHATLNTHTCVALCVFTFSEANISRGGSNSSVSGVVDVDGWRQNFQRQGWRQRRHNTHYHRIVYVRSRICYVVYTVHTVWNCNRVIFVSTLQSRIVARRAHTQSKRHERNHRLPSVCAPCTVEGTENLFIKLECIVSSFDV